VKYEKIRNKVLRKIGDSKVSRSLIEYICNFVVIASKSDSSLCAEPSQKEEVGLLTIKALSNYSVFSISFPSIPEDFEISLFCLIAHDELYRLSGELKLFVDYQSGHDL
jgi:hypothetical protein